MRSLRLLPNYSKFGPLEGWIWPAPHGRSSLSRFPHPLKFAGSPTVGRCRYVQYLPSSPGGGDAVAHETVKLSTFRERSGPLSLSGAELAQTPRRSEPANLHLRGAAAGNQP